jgi:hypothetical protein
MPEIAAAGGAVAWIGATLLAVSDERRRGAVGLALVGLGLAAAEVATARGPAAAALVGGGLVAAALRGRGPRPAPTPPPGSTPRLMGSLVVLAVVGLLGGVVLGAPGGIAMLAASAVSAIAAGRVLTADRRWTSLGAGSALALGLGALGGPQAVVAGAVVAAGLGAIPGGDRAEAR